MFQVTLLSCAFPCNWGNIASTVSPRQSTASYHPPFQANEIHPGTDLVAYITPFVTFPQYRIQTLALLMHNYRMIRAPNFCYAAGKISKPLLALSTHAENLL